MTITTIVRANHRDTCNGTELVKNGTWDSSLFFKEKVYRDRLGRRNKGGEPWLRLVCNSSAGCPAEVLINVVDLEILAEKELK